MLTPDEIRAFEQFVAPLYFVKNSDTMFNQDELTAAQRFLAPTPKFQNIIQFIGVFLGLLGATLMKLEADNLVVLPIWLAWVATKVTIISAAIGTIVAQFSVDYKAKAKAEILDNV